MKVTGLLIFAIFGMASVQLNSLVPVTRRHFILAAGLIDGHPYIFRNGVFIMRINKVDIGVDTVNTIVSGFLTTETGNTVNVDGGVVYGHDLHPSNTEAIRSVLSQANINLEDFIQQTGTSSPVCVFEVTAGAISLNGTYKNIDCAIIFLLSTELIESNTKGQDLVTSLITGDQNTGLIRTFTFAAAKLDGHAYIFRNSELVLQGSPLEIGENGVFPVVSGFLTTETGHHVAVGSGLLYVRSLHPRNTEAIRSALSRADMTLKNFIQQTGTSSPPHKVIEVTAGVISISGTYRIINAAVLLILISDVTETSTEGQTVVVTERAAPATLTVSHQVTLTKTSTSDKYITITSPVYPSAVVTDTNFLRQTVTVTEEQLIRSSVAGSVIENTIPVSTQLVLTVTDTATNYFVSTAVETVTSTLQHFVSIFSFRTIMVNNIITSTVIYMITRTSIITAYITSTAGSTVYSTTAMTLTISNSPATTYTSIPVDY